jgi:hypothetical protein
MLADINISISLPRDQIENKTSPVFQLRCGINSKRTSKEDNCT